jgi:hypothetical protein
MSNFIGKKFPLGIPQTASVSSQVHNGKYDLIGPEGVVIAPDFWEDLLEPGWTVLMSLWPIHPEAELHGDTPAPSAHDEQHMTNEPTRQSFISHESQKEPIETDISSSSEGQATKSHPLGNTPISLPIDEEPAIAEPFKASLPTLPPSPMIRCPICNIFTGEKDVVMLHAKSNCANNPIEDESENTSSDSDSDSVDDQLEPEGEVSETDVNTASTTTAQPSVDASTKSKDSAQTAKSKSTTRRTSSNKKPKSGSFFLWVAGTRRPAGHAGTSTKKGKAPSVPTRKKS